MYAHLLTGTSAKSPEAAVAQALSEAAIMLTKGGCIKVTLSDVEELPGHHFKAEIIVSTVQEGVGDVDHTQGKLNKEQHEVLKPYPLRPTAPNHDDLTDQFLAGAAAQGDISAYRHLLTAHSISNEYEMAARLKDLIVRDFTTKVNHGDEMPEAENYVPDIREMIGRPYPYLKPEPQK